MTLNHEMACEHLLDYLLGELDDAQGMAFESHARHCPTCHDEMMTILPVHNRLTEEDIAVPDHDWFAAQKNRLLMPALAIRPPVGEPPIQSHPVVQTNHQTEARHGKRHWVQRRRWVSTMVAGLLILLVGGGFAWFHTGSQIHTSPNPPVSFVQQVALQANDAYPSARGVALVTNNHDKPTLILYVNHLPQQSSWGCYDLWGVQGGKRYSLGEFTVDAQGTGALSVQIPTLEQYESIEVTLEPYWGDNQPQGPQVLAAPWGTV